MTTTIFRNKSALYNNGKVAITNDLIFGLSVWDGEVWVQLSIDEVTKEDIEKIIELINGDPLFLWKDELNNICKEKFD